MTKPKQDYSLAEIPCYDFPYCPCGQALKRWIEIWRQWKADEPADAPCALSHIPLEVVEGMQLSMFSAFRCISANCSSRKCRAQAQIYLLHPGFRELNRRHPL